MRRMQAVSTNSNQVINEYSNQFLKDFIQLLRTSHGEKRIHINRFYQEYIANKSHIHMNSTKWHSLTNLAQYLGREGICRVDEEEPGENGRGGIFISWIDNSPEALRRQEAIRKKERQDRGDEEREQMLIRAQIARAQRDKGIDGDDDSGDEGNDQTRELKREAGEKLKLSFAPKISSTPKPPNPSIMDKDNPSAISADQQADPKSSAAPSTSTSLAASPSSPLSRPPSQDFSTPAPSTPQISIKPKNVFNSVKKPNPLAGKKSSAGIPQQRPMSEAERIMKEELERKRLREERMNGGGGKRLKLG